jgi:CRISPR system Cascade subunit CasC
MFLQLHTLTSYPGTLLNRDDIGRAKRLPFGGATRTRVSSQCLKYHWRNFEGEHALYNMDVPRSLRSRETFLRRIGQPLMDDGVPAPLAYAATASLKTLILGESEHIDSSGYLKKSSFKNFIAAGKDEDTDTLRSGQVTILGVPEVRHLRELAKREISALRDNHSDLVEDGEVPDDVREEAYSRFREYFKSSSDIAKNLKGLKQASGLDAALFGRMATSDVLARGDAAVHVAHALTTHEQETESDYFSAVDELRRDDPQESGEMGAGHINSQELTSGLFYSYVTIDVPLLVSNLSGVERENWTEGNTDLAAEVVRRFVHLVATVSPGAKLGSTAPHAYAHCLFAEAGTAQPRTLANAFQTPVPKGTEAGVLAESYDALAEYVADVDGMYGQQTDRRLAAMGPADRLTDGRMGVDETVTVPDVAAWTANQIQTAQ